MASTSDSLGTTAAEGEGFAPVVVARAAQEAHAPHQGPLDESFRFAAQGVWYFLKTQRNIRILFVVAALVLVAAAAVGVSALSWGLLVLAIVAVLAAEMLNTALELVLDLVHPKRHPLAKAAKDIAAGAVLVTCLGAVVVGLLVFGAALL